MIILERKESDVQSSFKVTVVLNNQVDKPFVDTVLDALSYILSVIATKYSLILEIITTHPKLYSRSCRITNTSTLYECLDKVFRRKHTPELLTSTENIDDDALKKLVNSRKSLDLDSDDDGKNRRELFVVADTDALLYRDSLANVQAKYKIYMHRTKAFHEGVIDGFSEVLVKRKTVLETESSTICRVLSAILHNVDFEKDPKHDDIDEDPKLEEGYYIPTGTVCFCDSIWRGNTQLIEGRKIDIDVDDMVKSISDHKHNGNDILCDLMACLISDVRYLVSTQSNLLTDEQLDAISVVVRLLRVLDSHYKHINDKRYTVMSSVLQRNIDSFMNKHGEKMFADRPNKTRLSDDNQHSDPENDSSVVNSLQVSENKEQCLQNHEHVIRSSLTSLSVKSSVTCGKLGAYLRKKTDDAVVNKVCNDVRDAVRSVSDRIDFVGDEYQSCISDEDEDIYKTVLTMSDWYDEIKEGNCVGVVLDLQRLPYYKGRYDVVINSCPSCVGSSSEMFHTLNMTLAEQNGPINIHRFNMINNIGPKDDADVVSHNCVVPLYIHQDHWKIAKIYLNPICNILLFDSLNINDQSAWKLIYNVLISTGSKIVQTSGVKRAIKYLFSLWLTTNVLSYENGYSSGLKTFLRRVRNNPAFSKNIDPIMVAGQIVSTGFNVDEEDVSRITKMMYETKFIELYNPVSFSDFYEETLEGSEKSGETVSTSENGNKEQERCEPTQSESSTTPKKINLEHFLTNVKREMKEVLGSIRFMLGFRSFIKSYGVKNLLTFLERSYGIPSQSIIDRFENAVSDPHIDEQIDRMILFAHYQIPEIVEGLKPYRDSVTSELDGNTLKVLLQTSHMSIRSEESTNDEKSEEELLDDVVDHIMQELEDSENLFAHRDVQNRILKMHGGSDAPEKS
ncbi:hypothetical protein YASMINEVIRUS_889 [Yasminevirus sp. GU-2018]|uniref:Uncharacterized protein n=1 Tax=Yasminevirus sp. GU-2018 TaxID=2420051 RepID=A0A5K0UBG3_9VIRU|nr:hypothetical protein YASMINEVIRUS_889 [Yasminevirus sp. GU-2018]